jgi:hypothetical protein
MYTGLVSVLQSHVPGGAADPVYEHATCASAGLADHVNAIAPATSAAVHKLRMDPP